MIYRSFRHFIDDRGSDIVLEWLNTLNLRDQAKFEVDLLYLQTQLIPDINKLKQLDKARDPDADGIWELRFKFNKVQNRPLLYEGPSARQMTILFIAYEKGGRWVPSGALKTTQRRRRIVEENPKRSVEHGID